MELLFESLKQSICDMLADEPGCASYRYRWCHHEYAATHTQIVPGQLYHDFPYSMIVLGYCCSTPNYKRRPPTIDELEYLCHVKDATRRLGI